MCAWLVLRRPTHYNKNAKILCKHIKSLYLTLKKLTDNKFTMKAWLFRFRGFKVALLILISSNRIEEHFFKTYLYDLRHGVSLQ